MTKLKTNEARAARNDAMATRVMFTASALAVIAMFGLLAYFA